MKIEGLHPHLILAAMWTVCHVPITMVTLHSLLLSDLRCHPGWTGNRCHVKEKLVPSTAASEPEAQYLGRKPAHFPPRHACRFTLGWQLMLLICPQTPSTWASPSDCCCWLQVSSSAFSQAARDDATHRESNSRIFGCRVVVVGGRDGWVFSAASTGNPAP